MLGSTSTRGGPDEGSSVTEYVISLRSRSVFTNGSGSVTLFASGENA